jgi:hypothetical protein
VRALFEAGTLFRDAALFVGGALGYAYNREEDRRTTTFLQDVRNLPTDASEIRPR